MRSLVVRILLLTSIFLLSGLSSSLLIDHERSDRAAASERNRRAPIIPGVGAAGVQIGMTKNQVVAVLGAPYRKSAEDILPSRARRSPLYAQTFEDLNRLIEEHRYYTWHYPNIGVKLEFKPDTNTLSAIYLYSSNANQRSANQVKHRRVRFNLRGGGVSGRGARGCNVERAPGTFGMRMYLGKTAQGIGLQSDAQALLDWQRRLVSVTEKQNNTSQISFGQLRGMTVRLNPQGTARYILIRDPADGEPSRGESSFKSVHFCFITDGGYARHTIKRVSLIPDKTHALFLVTRPNGSKVVHLFDLGDYIIKDSVPLGEELDDVRSLVLNADYTAWIRTKSALWRADFKSENPRFYKSSSSLLGDHESLLGLSPSSQGDYVITVRRSDDPKRARRDSASTNQAQTDQPAHFVEIFDNKFSNQIYHQELAGELSYGFLDERQGRLYLGYKSGLIESIKLNMGTGEVISKTELSSSTQMVYSDSISCRYGECPSDTQCVDHRCLKSTESGKSQGVVKTIIAHPTQDIAVVQSESERLAWYHSATGEPLYSSPSFRGVSDLQYSLEGELFGFMRASQSILRWGPQGGRASHTKLSDHKDERLGFSLLPNDRAIFYGSGSLEIFNDIKATILNGEQREYEHHQSEADVDLKITSHIKSWFSHLNDVIGFLDRDRFLTNSEVGVLLWHTDGRFLGTLLRGVESAFFGSRDQLVYCLSSYNKLRVGVYNISKGVDHPWTIPSDLQSKPTRCRDLEESELIHSIFDHNGFVHTSDQFEHETYTLKLNQAYRMRAISILSKDDQREIKAVNAYRSHDGEFEFWIDRPLGESCLAKVVLMSPKERKREVIEWLDNHIRSRRELSDMMSTDEHDLDSEKLLNELYRSGGQVALNKRGLWVFIDSKIVQFDDESGWVSQRFDTYKYQTRREDPLFSVDSIAIDHQSQWLAISNGDVVHIYRVSTGQMEREFKINRLKRPFERESSTLSFSRDGAYLVRQGSRYGAQLWGARAADLSALCAK